MIEARVITPDSHLGKVLDLFDHHRGVQEKMEIWHERGGVVRCRENNGPIDYHS